MTEALEKRVKTVTMRAESLATTEADFFKTFLERYKSTQRNLNNLSARLCPRTAQQETRSAARDSSSVLPVPVVIFFPAAAILFESLGRTIVSEDQDLLFMEQILEAFTLHLPYLLTRGDIHKMVDTQPIHVE